MDHDSSAYRDITPPTYARPSPVQTLSSSQTIEVEIGGKHHYVHSSDSILHEELATAVSSTQHQFMDQDNPFLTQPAKTTMQDSSPASYRQRERRSVAQIARAFEEDDDNPFLISNKPIATKKRPYVVQEERSYSDITTAPTASTAPSQGSSSSTYIDSSRPSEPTAKTPPPQPRHFQSRTSKSKRSGDTLDYSSVTVEDLKRSRKELKAWEANFKNTHQRTATQDDITKDEAMGKR
ncbi:hypothetical protein BC939DRAFT_475844 [Gamsiella multidivaricata]|uniref:uncharacterized protein n=1 Tax=Gamsiella multidivaricata TaxID=101098 RepID=UPI00221ECCA8|nr:uncharacterized protein BC939DRAFT_475844 [Gamsiella multidivaricata]KAG0370702.1 hypothetical protein BGZ54_004647 [Gamsiella multidivaricata]KAI7826145.1 hypothetical protein BC939DRAFT_475844 [Gamsiella multidivaricata]